MTKILLINRSEEDIVSDTNKGSEAVLIATVNILKQAIPGVALTSFLNCSETLAQKLDLSVVRIKNSRNLPRFFGELKSLLELACCLLWALVKKIFHADLSFLVKGKRLKEYLGADVIVHVGMDYYSDDVGLPTIYRHSLDILMATLLKKPVVIWAESMGPFRGKVSGWMARTTLNRVNLITVRDSLSRDFLIEAGINRPPLYVTADPAFFFEPTSRDRVEAIFTQEGVDVKAKVLIGVNPSHSFIIPPEERKPGTRDNYIKVMSWLGSFLANLLPETLFNWLLNIAKKTSLYSPVDAKYQEYQVFFARLIDWLIEEYDATVLLIPHDQAMGQLYGDTAVTKDIAERTRHKDGITTISRNYNAAEIKGIIGQCDLFIGARFHAVIAALSQRIPIVCFPYYHKFALISDLGQDRYICRSFTLEEAKEKVADAWTRREDIEKELVSRIKSLNELALRNGDLVSELITP